MDSTGIQLYLIIFGIILLLLGGIGVIYGYIRMKKLKKEKEAEQARYMSLHSKRESGDEVLGKHFAPTNKLSVPKTDKDIYEENNTDTNN